MPKGKRVRRNKIYTFLFIENDLPERVAKTEDLIAPRELVKGKDEGGCVGGVWGGVWGGWWGVSFLLVQHRHPVGRAQCFVFYSFVSTGIQSAGQQTFQYILS